MDILIIGGSGCISSHIVRHALAAGHQLSVLNRGNHPPPAGVEQLTADRNDPAALKAALSGRSFDACIDMVCFKPEQLQLLTEVLPDHGHLILCSTVCALGFDWQQWPVPEDAAYRPNSDYGRGKAAAEVWLRDYAAARKKAFTILRPSTTFDETIGVLRQVCWDGSAWLAGIRSGHPIVIADGGMGMNQFMHADDCGRAFCMAAGNAAAYGKTLHVVGSTTSWRSHHETVMDVLGKSAPLINVPGADIRQALPDNGIFNDIFAHHGVFADTAITDCIGFEAQITLHQAIERTVSAMDAASKIPDQYLAGDWEQRLIKQFTV